MKSFVKAEVVELNLQATAQYNPLSEGYDAEWADKNKTEIKEGTLVHGDPWPSGDETGIIIEMPGR